MNASVRFRYWRVHFMSDPFDHYVNIDCGECVSESRAVALAERAYPSRGSVTTCIEDHDRVCARVA